MATYSQNLEAGLKELSDRTETVLTLCNRTRTDLQDLLHADVHFRNYPYDSLKLFEYISDLERAALWVIGGIEVIRRQNADLMTADQSSADSAGDVSSADSADEDSTP